ncbi:MAG: hypothetical protein H7Y05_09335 [Steroidobacteraceae bacterium]|nr:hypothetical protein [Deltaproteobacteria bacterium]
MNIISPNILLLSLFVLNILLVLLDASLGYHLAPRLLRSTDPDEPELQESAVRTVRGLLTVLVVLYMFFNCLGYFRGNGLLLLIVTAVIVFDLGGQLYLRQRSGRKGEQP